MTKCQHIPSIYLNSALRTAASDGHDQCMTSLIQLGAEVNSTNIKGATALFFAVDKGHTESV